MPQLIPTAPRVLSNRGVNGIDGVVSTALGVAQSGSGQGARTIALLGDLTFLHDVSGLVNLPESPCTFVVLDNGGGGIFSFLPQATSVEPAVFEQLFGTPPTSDLSAVARGFGLPVHEVTELSQLEVALAARRDADAVARPGHGARPGAERRAARRDQPGGPSLAAVRVGEGVDVERLPVGLSKVNSTLALPEIFHPISWTQR